MRIRELQPGDHLLYKPNRVWSWGMLIAIKTWQPVCHIEVFIGQPDALSLLGYSVASRDGIGINRYPLRENGLHYILRPNRPFDLGRALKWFETVRGQKYDWLGLARFVIPGKIRAGNNAMMFCSEFSARLDREGNFLPFGLFVDADAVAPASYLYSPLFDCSELEA